MKILKTSKGNTILLDDDDWEKVRHWSWDECRYGYARRTSWSNGKRIRYRMHSLIMNPPKGMQVDHIDGNRLNNQRSNLRIVTLHENNRNMINTKKPEGYKGVYSNTKQPWKFEARLTLRDVDNKCIRRYGGLWDSAEEAAVAYDIMAMAYGIMALNFPEEWNDVQD